MAATNPKNKTLNGQDYSTQHDSKHGWSQFYSTRGWGNGRGHGCTYNNVPRITNPFPTHYSQQGPINAPTYALSTVTNTDNATVGNPTYVVKHITPKSNRGENKSQWLYSKVVNCDTLYLGKIFCCDTANGATNNDNLALPYANYKTHHFNLSTLQSSQDVAPIFYVVYHYAPTSTSSVPPFIFRTSSGTQDSRSAKNEWHKLDI